MKNAIKIRIIHSMEYNAEAEYLMEFFRFIGCLVFDAVVYEQQYQAWDEHLCIMNQEYGVDIVLNYFGTDKWQYSCGLFGTERIYIYFNLEAQICEVTVDPLQEMSTQKYSSKRLARQKALSHLIEAIWYNDSDNKKEIERIRELYIPQNGENDIFYVLQAKHSFNALTMPDLVQKYKRDLQDRTGRKEIEVYNAISIPVLPYLQIMLSELFRIHDSLEGENPYIVFAKIKTVMHILTIGDCINDDWIRSSPQNRMVFSSISIFELLEQCHILIKNDTWFITIAELMAELYGRCNNYDKYCSCYEYMISRIEISSSYCDGIYYRLGVCSEYLGDETKAITFYQEALKCNPLNHKALFKLGFFKAREGHFNSAESLLHEIEVILDVNTGMLSLEKALDSYEAFMLLAKIAINSCKEYSAKGAIRNAMIVAEEFGNARTIERIADRSESAFQDFLIFHNEENWSTYYVFSLLEEWARNIVNEKYIVDIAKVRLSFFGDQN